jgi:hypothetical protein
MCAQLPAGLTGSEHLRERNDYGTLEAPVTSQPYSYRPRPVSRPGSVCVGGSGARAASIGEADVYGTRPASRM